LWQNRRRPSRLVKELALAHIRDLDQKAQELVAMKMALEHLVHGCHGDDRPECPILDALARPAMVVVPARRIAVKPLARPRKRVPA
ncbi:MAG: MerR family DNA-binding protein, partial [Pseudomonadota bacterium]